MTKTSLPPESHTGRNNGIDLFRLFGAFFVMLLHTNLGRLVDTEIQDNIRLLSRWAVPFFFMTTGFFLSKKIRKHNNFDFHHIQGNVANLITVLWVASLIYLPFNLFQEVYPTSVKETITGTYYHLWFVGSMIFGYMFLWYTYFIKKEKYLPYICGTILLYSLFTDSYDQFLGLNLDFDLGRFILCIPFMYAGMWISEHEFRLSQLPLIITTIIIGLGISFLESDMFYKLFGYKRYLHQILFGTVIFVIPFFILSTLINIKDNRLVRWGRKYSLFIYLYHPIYYYFHKDIYYKYLPFDWFWILRMMGPVIGFIVLLSAAILLDYYAKPLFQIVNGKFMHGKKHSV